MLYDTYDIRNRLLQADTKNVLHKNAPHVGDRYVIVLFNKDMNYKGTDMCKRSTAIRNAEPLARPRYVDTHESAEVQRARQALLDLLNSTKIPQDRCGDKAVNHPKYGTHTAHLISFGMSQSRKSRKERAERGLYTRATVNYNNEKYADIYNALCTYMSLFAPDTFGETAVYHACIISKNSISGTETIGTSGMHR